MVHIIAQLRDLHNLFRHPLYLNSFYILLTYLSSAFFGFIFWIAAAKMYTPQEVGIATALISSMSLIVLLAKVGLDFSIIRYFPARDKSVVYSTSIVITTLFSLIFGLIFILGVDLFSPELKDIYTLESAGLLFIFIIANATANLAGIAFVALRRSEYYLLQNLLAGSKILFLFPLAYLGAFGIFGSVGISFILTAVFSSLLIAKSGIKHSFRVDRGFIAGSFHFSLGNYLVGLFQTAPNLVLPIMVLNILGADAAAYYYIAFSVAFILFIVPNAISTSLFVEGSNGESLRQSTIRSSIAIYALLIPAVVILYFSGDIILGLIGKEYAANGFELFRVMIFTSLVLPVTYIYSAVKRVQNGVRDLVLLNGVVFASLILLAQTCTTAYGIVKIGYAWVISYAVGVLLIGLGTLWERIATAGTGSHV